jgi:hypothetical protein
LIPHLNTPEEIVPLPRDLSSQSHQYKNDFNMSPEAVAARAAKKIEQSRIAAEVAARLPDAGAAADDDHQFHMDGQGKGGKKRTKTRAVRRKRSYKKSIEIVQEEQALWCNTQNAPRTLKLLLSLMAIVS